MSSVRYMLFYKLRQAEIAKAKAQVHPEAELLLFENYSLSSPTLSSKNSRTYSKRCAKKKKILYNEIA